MAPIIYSASERPPFLPQQNVFQYLLGGPALSPLPAFDDSLPAFIDGPTGFTLTRADLRDRALRVVGALHARGLRKGDTVCIFAFNSLEYVIVAYACLAAGVILSPANGAYTSDELAHQLNDSGSALIFVAPSHVATLEDAKPRLKRAFGVDNVVLLCKPEEAKAGATPYSCVHDLMVSNPAGPERLDGADAQSTAFLCYSSGTTGLPKGVMTTHFNLTSQIQGGNVMFTRMHAGKDVVIDFLPLSHIYAIVVALLQPISQGAAVVILPRFDEPSVLAAIERVS
jgi:acyl-CoA synthetase (AMP-forming)/AMP-acid ligase II